MLLTIIDIVMHFLRHYSETNFKLAHYFLIPFLHTFIGYTVAAHDSHSENGLNMIESWTLHSNFYPCHSSNDPKIIHFNNESRPFRKHEPKLGRGKARGQET